MNNAIYLPGLIDPHVHLRDPGQTEKEDFYTGTCAALAGGYTTILDMPNNKTPITTFERLKEKIEIAKEKIVCDVGFYFGSLGDNLEEFEKIKNLVFGLKLYLNQTTGNFLIDKNSLARIFSAFPSSLPILVHAEERTVEDVLKIIERTKRKVHFCHISLQSELEMIIAAKNRGLPITCGVTPHHLFLNEHDAVTLGPFGKMKPPLRSKKDVEFLWKNLKAIDVVESDHAPHTIGEKLGKRGVTQLEGFPTARTRSQQSKTSGALTGRKAGAGPRADNVPFGVPGLETTLPLLLTAVNQNQLTIDDIVRLCFENPAKIFGIKQDKNTKVEIDLHKSYIVNHKSLHTKCGWSPFNGWKVKGKVQQVFLRGTKVFEDGKILATPGSGKVL